MSLSTTAESTEAIFESSRGCFEELLAWLTGDEAARLDHGELEEQLDCRGRELLRRLYQGELDLRAADEARLDTVRDADGVLHGAVEAGHGRPLSTIFGTVTVTRLAYRHRGHANLYPADGQNRTVDKVRLPGVRAYETGKVVFGEERRIVVCHSQGLHDKQSQGFDQTLTKARRQLAEVAARLARGKTRKPRNKVEDEIAEILKPRWLSRVISTTLSGEQPAELRLIWRTKPKARVDLEAEVFGKRILFTDKNKSLASMAQVVIEYRSQEEAESDFRQMKDPKVVSFSPMYHFTDHKIRVHVFHCVLALMAARLMVREADHAGVHLSVRKLLHTLAGIQETVLLYQGERGRPRARRMLTETDATQQHLYDLFGLDTYAP